MTERNIDIGVHRVTDDDERRSELEMKAKILEMADQAIAMCRHQRLSFAAYLFEVAKEEIRSTTN